jgi:hypothetical protein
MCNECFLGNVAWDASRTYDTLGPCDGKPVVLVHGALIGRQCLIHEARALADVGFRCAHAPSCTTHTSCLAHACPPSWPPQQHGTHPLLLCGAPTLARRVIVPDLPAHGALFRQRPLTLDSAVATLHSVIQQEVPGKKVGACHAADGTPALVRGAAQTQRPPERPPRCLAAAPCTPLPPTHTRRW